MLSGVEAPWKQWRIGEEGADVIVSTLKPCARCPIYNTFPRLRVLHIVNIHTDSRRRREINSRRRPRGSWVWEQCGSGCDCTSISMDDNPSPVLQEAGANKQSTTWEHLSTLCCRHRNPEYSTWSFDFRHNKMLAMVSETPVGKTDSIYSQYTVSPSFEAFMPLCLCTQFQSDLKLDRTLASPVYELC